MLFDYKYIFVIVLHQSKAKKCLVSKNNIKINNEKAMCLDCNITNDVCVRYIQIRKLQTVILKLHKLFIVLNKSEQCNTRYNVYYCIYALFISKNLCDSLFIWNNIVTKLNWYF